MKHTWDKIQDATTPNELRKAIVEELHLRAWQERAASSIGRTTKAKRAEAEHAAIALENLAADLTRTEIVNQQPAGLTESEHMDAERIAEQDRNDKHHD